MRDEGAVPLRIVAEAPAARDALVKGVAAALGNAAPPDGLPSPNAMLMRPRDADRAAPALVLAR